MSLMKVEDIKAEKDFMMRDELDKSLVAEYADNIEKILDVAPLEVYETENGNYLTDGFHRFSAAISNGYTEVSCIIKQGSVNDARAAACVANLRHGKALNRKEKQNAIKQYVKIYWNHSNRWLANDLGVNDKTVGKYRAKIHIDDGIEYPTILIAQDGKEYPFAGAEFSAPDESESLDENELTFEQFKEQQLILAEGRWNDDFTKKVIHGDTFEILPTLDEHSVDLLIVDPPYGITTEKWDLHNKSDLIGFTREWLVQARRILKTTGRMFVCWSRQYMFELKPIFDEVFEHYPFIFGNMLVWHWNNAGSQPDNRKRYKLTWEPVFYFYGTEAEDLQWTSTDISGKSWEGRGWEQMDVWEFTIPQSNYKDDQKIHPTQKPRELYEHIIRTASKTGDLVLDPFAGSGTTGHACELWGRNYKLIEREQEYYDSIHERLHKFWLESKEYENIEKEIKKQWDGKQEENEDEL